MTFESILSVLLEEITVAQEDAKAKVFHHQSIAGSTNSGLPTV